jgi:hypothetical protein
MLFCVQAYYYAQTEETKNARDILKDDQYFDACVDFCESYDQNRYCSLLIAYYTLHTILIHQNSFDPEYESLPLEFFAPMVKRVVSKEPYWHADHMLYKENQAKHLLTVGDGYPSDDSAKRSRL